MSSFLRSAALRRALPHLTEQELLWRFEFMLGALRLREGFELKLFTERTGLPVSAVEPALAEAERRGLLERDLHQVRPTPLGFDFLSDLQTLFLK